MAAHRGSRLSDPFFSLIVFSIYSGIMGAILLLAPKTILLYFRVEETINSYAYMLGFVLLCSSFYYVASGLARARNFARLTVYTSFASPAVTTNLFLAGNVPPNFVILSVVDFLGGAWTFTTLKLSPTEPYSPLSSSSSAA